MRSYPAPDLVRLNHIGITVNDLDRSIALFTTCFGFSVTSRGGRPPGMAARLTGVVGAEIEIAFVERSGLIIELLAFTPRQTDAAFLPPNHTGAAHVALDVPAIATVLEQGHRLGLRILGEVVQIPAGPNKGGRVAYVRQDTGLTLELIETAEKPVDKL